MVAQGVWRFAVVVMLMLACLLGASARDAKAEEGPSSRPMEWIQEFPALADILEMAIGLLAAMAIGIPMFYMKRQAAMKAATGKMD